MKTSTKIILFGVAAIAFTGLRKILENELTRLKSLAIINETAAERAKNPDDGYIFQKRAEHYRRLVRYAELGEWINPASYAPLKSIYDQYFSGRDYKPSKT